MMMTTIVAYALWRRFGPGDLVAALIPIVAIYVICTRVDHRCATLVLWGAISVMIVSGALVIGVAMAFHVAIEPEQLVVLPVVLAGFTGWLFATVDLLYRKHWVPAIVSIGIMAIWFSAVMMPQTH